MARAVEARAHDRRLAAPVALHLGVVPLHIGVGRERAPSSLRQDGCAIGALTAAAAALRLGSGARVAGGGLQPLGRWRHVLQQWVGCRVDGAHELEAGRVVPLQPERPWPRCAHLGVDELAVRSKVPHAQLREVLLRVERRVGRRAVGPLPQPLLSDRCGPARLDRVAQLGRQAWLGLG